MSRCVKEYGYSENTERKTAGGVTLACSTDAILEKRYREFYAENLKSMQDSGVSRLQNLHSGLAISW
jgi:hypothetical protein